MDEATEPLQGLSTSVRNRPDEAMRRLLNASSIQEKSMFIGGGILGTIVLILLVLWLVRRV